MTESAVNPAGTAVPAATVVPPVAASAPAAVVVTPPAEEPSWLAGRLERERKAVLKALGVENVDDGKKAIEELKTRRDAEKSEAQRQSEEIAALKPKVASYEKTIKARAAVELSGLTDEQRAAVASLAGDDAAKQLETIDALKPTWAKAATPAAAPPLPAPASTTNAATPPAAPPPAGQVDHAAVYDDLVKKNPMMAAHYLDLHGPAVFEGRKKRNT